MNIKLFYSWQSWTPAKYNRDFIIRCLEIAIEQLEKISAFPGVKFSIQDSVVGEPGTPSVSDTIMKKRIPECDIFIADISVVNALPKAGWVVRLFRYLANVPARPSQNVNVFFEYGAAQQALGREKVLCVLNSAYGSPIEDPNNIPFDVRHASFPVEYNYSEQNENVQEAIQKKLVDDLVTALKPTVTYVLQSLKSKYAPLLTWPDWERRINPAEAFYRNQRIAEIEATIKKAIGTPTASIRLLGLSGLGKTRILLELFRPQ